MLDSQGIPNVWYNFFNAWPSKWQGPALDASQSIVASQSLTLVHEGIEKSALAEAYSLGKGLL
jgi:phage tail-like protein